MRKACLRLFLWSLDITMHIELQFYEIPYVTRSEGKVKTKAAIVTPPGDASTSVAPRQGGLNQSSQHGFCRSVPGIGQVLQRVFSSQAFCVVGR